MIVPRLSRIVIDPAVAGSAVARSVRERAGEVAVAVEPTAPLAEGTRHISLTEGKRVLLVREFRGRSVKVCQCRQPHYSCCNLHTLADANGCAMECSYCILQFYLTSPHLSVFANLEDILAEVRAAAEAEPERQLRIGTGELADSLLLDPLTRSTAITVPFFRALPNAILELKTKTDNVDGLLEEDGGQHTVVSWSVNPPRVAETDELKTATIDARLDAARRVAAAGYPVGFHIDPMVLHDGWEEGYRDLVDRLLDAVPAERIAWVSVGALRFPAEMRRAMAERFPRSKLRTGEFTRGADGKLHYLRPLRIAMFRAVVDRLRARFEPLGDRAPIVYLCMEAPDVWRRVFGSRARSTLELEQEFGSSYTRRFLA